MTAAKKTDRRHLATLLAGCDEGRHPGYERKTQRALKALATLGIRTPRQLITRVRELPARQRELGIYVLGRLEQKNNVPLFYDLAKSDRSRKVRQAAIDGLGSAGGKRALQKLQALVQSRELPSWHRFVACHYLAFSHAPALLPFFVEVVGDRTEDPLLRGLAEEGIANLAYEGDFRLRDWKRAHAQLLECLADPEGEVRFWAIFALGNMKSRRALPALKKLARSDPFVGSIGWSNAEEARDFVHLIETGRYLEPDAMERKIAREAT